MNTDQPGFHIDGPAGLAMVDRALDQLDLLWARSPEVSAEDRTLFTLAVSEVATNVVQHNGTAPVTMTVDVRVAGDVLCADITDSAPPASIEWRDVAMPDADSESGRGLALARAALDEFSHTFDEHGNTWTLRRHLTLAS
ncbi:MULTISPECIES: ATP-binding protein [unclassified Microbacterium]|uniref:ATP-binding protein n=1 Tax=unclassified Microbacterium TaxID=2609290 RepID=UPI0015FFE580|nr:MULTISPECIES: ATP-binding protein [unclassified Microbacterium]MBT2483838.1 ATP-binding protein [Microbacterium sp. ISL-108]